MGWSGASKTKFLEVGPSARDSVRVAVLLGDHAQVRAHARRHLPHFLPPHPQHQEEEVTTTKHSTRPSRAVARSVRVAAAAESRAPDRKGYEIARNMSSSTLFKTKFAKRKLSFLGDVMQLATNLARIAKAAVPARTLVRVVGYACVDAYIGYGYSCTERHEPKRELDRSIALRVYGLQTFNHFAVQISRTKTSASSLTRG
ncbi:hypothetical protein MSG28_014387 [Choristoneura fumiferana]|uniref:Uncharacterized protein n=1 Tax=Choristoneura fumiferana TaxID=7141 RepID=A0ACC0JRJ9_CHOFU|nr:hypothetical protein MSG28_014387 [Choristoneura fumiferana]